MPEPPEAAVTAELRQILLIRRQSNSNPRSKVKPRMLFFSQSRVRSPDVLQMAEGVSGIRKFVNPRDLRVAAEPAEPPLSASETAGRSTQHDDVTRIAAGSGAYNNGGDSRKNTRFVRKLRTATASRRYQTFSPATRRVRTTACCRSSRRSSRGNLRRPGNVVRCSNAGKKKPSWATIARRRSWQARRINLATALCTDYRTDPVFLGLQKTRLVDR